MDSLQANYASSDEEGGGRGGEEAEATPRSAPPSEPLSTSIPPPRSTSASLFSSLTAPKSSSSSSPTTSPITTTQTTSSSSSLFSSLPPPKSSSLFSSLPPPRSTAPSSSSPSPPSLFSSLSSPKSLQPKPPPPRAPSAKKVVQFRPPINPALLKPDNADEDDDEDSGMGRKRTRDFSSKPLSSIMPPPKHTLGLAPSSRRSVIDADVPVPRTEAAKEEASDGCLGELGSCGGQWAGGYAQIGVDGYSDSSAVGGDVADVASGWAPSAGSYEVSGAYGSYEGYDTYGSYGGQWDYGTSASGAMSATEMPEPAIAAVKRGRNEIPSEILEIKQDELIKNRPREDQVRLTGIAFGPSHQPTSAKGKPSKLHKRKHQIGSLYFDMKQNEMELAERRAKGFLTKKETQAKYGW